jgi:adenylylsulfate kinase-like enzyme
MLGQRPMVVWFTGLSGAGKSTIANLVETRLLNPSGSADVRTPICLGEISMTR